MGSIKLGLFELIGMKWDACRDMGGEMDDVFKFCFVLFFIFGGIFVYDSFYHQTIIHEQQCDLINNNVTSSTNKPIIHDDGHIQKSMTKLYVHLTTTTTTTIDSFHFPFHSASSILDSHFCLSSSYPLHTLPPPLILSSHFLPTSTT